jgi:uncharacterized membrane protein
MRWFRKRSKAVPTPVQENIDSVAQIEGEFVRRRSRLDRVSDATSRFTGSVQFIVAHALFFTTWMGWNASWALGERAFDPYPFVLLNLVLAVEAVLLGTFVLMSQNRQNRQSDQWAHVVLQISLLAEQESTKTLQLLQQICERLGLHEAARDRELSQMIETTHLQTLVQELEKARNPEQVSPAPRPTNTKELLTVPIGHARLHSRDNDEDRSHCTGLSGRRLEGNKGRVG